MKLETESTDLSVSIADIKQEKFDPKVAESYINLYDTSFVVCKEELCKNRSDMVAVDAEVKDALFPVTLKEIVGKCIDKCFSKCLEKARYSNIEYSCPNANLSKCDTRTLAQLATESNNEGNKRTESEDKTNLPMAVAIETNEDNKSNNNNKINDKVQAKSTRYLSWSVKVIRQPRKIKNKNEPPSHRATVIRHNAPIINTSNSDGCKKNLKEAPIAMTLEISSIGNIEPTNTYSCSHCTFGAQCKSDLDAHIIQHIDQKLVPFTEIESRHDINLLTEHFGEKLFYCDHCHFNSRYKPSLIRHIKIHTVEKPFSCKYCPAKFSLKCNLVLHMRIHTRDKPFRCKHCPVKCRLKSALLVHMGTHMGEKPFWCDHCPVKYSIRSSLVRHMRSHTGEKSFSCDICHYKCKQEIDFMKHIRLHADMKTLHCIICDFEAPSKRSLVSHMKAHTGKILFSCDLCYYKCNKKSLIVTHMRKHTGERPYPCGICNYRSSQKSTLKRHMKIHV